MTILPTYKIEICFADPPLSPSTWVNVTTDVRLGPGIPIRYGRPDQYSDVQIATASFVLDNLTGTYTPDNTGSAYYPNVKPGRAVRITATEDGVSYVPAFYGYIDTLQFQWDNATGRMGNTLVTCVDLQSMLAGTVLVDDLVKVNIQQIVTSVQDYWPFTDPTGTTIPKNLGTGGEVLTQLLGYGSDLIEYQSDQLILTDDTLPVKLTTASFWAAARRSTYTGNLTLSTFVAATSTVDAELVSLSDTTLFNNVFLGSPSSANGCAFFSINETSFSGGSINTALTGTTVIAGTGGHHIAGTYSTAAGGTMTLYVDGVAEATATGVGASVAGSGVNSPWYVSRVGGCDLGAVRIAHTAIWDSALNAPSIAIIYQAGLTGFSGETSSLRASRALSYFNPSSPPTLTTIGTPGTQRMAPLTGVKGRTVLDLLTEVADTENGIFYIDKAGAATLRTRLAQYNQTSQLTLPTDSYDPSLSFVQDRSLLVNDETATAAGSVNPQRVTDATSISENGLRSDQQTLQTLDDNEALSYAQWRVGDGKAKTRAPQLNVDLMSQQTSQPLLLGKFWALDLGELLSVTGLPTNAPSTSVALIAQGIETTLTDTAYDALINTSYAPAGAWVLQDAALGVLDSTTILAY